MTARVELTDRISEADSEELWPVYDAIFGDQPDRATWQAEVWDRHVVRVGFRLARARIEGRLVGFAYGYTGQRGQWWIDQAARVHDRLLLMATKDESDPARRLYDSDGWSVVGPGLTEAQVILGKRI